MVIAGRVPGERFDAEVPVADVIPAALVVVEAFTPALKSLEADSTVADVANGAAGEKVAVVSRPGAGAAVDITATPGSMRT